MADLTFKLVASIKSLVIEQVKNSFMNHLHQRLESEFGEALDIFANEKGKLLLNPDNLITELAKDTESGAADSETLTTEHAKAKAALQVRADVRKQYFPQAWPLLVVEAEESGPIIPQSVTLFLQYLLAGT